MWFPTVADVIDLHDRILERGGGEPGVLHEGSIEAAIDRCRWGPFHRGDLAERAALLFRGVAQEHPFVDGNKRTAFELAYLFLRRNGYRLGATDDAVIEEAVAVARGSRTVDEIARWIRVHMENV